MLQVSEKYEKQILADNRSLRLKVECLYSLQGEVIHTLQGDDCRSHRRQHLGGGRADEVSFLANPKYADQLAETRAGAVIVRPEHAGDVRRA